MNEWAQWTSEFKIVQANEGFVCKLSNEKFRNADYNCSYDDQNDDDDDWTIHMFSGLQRSILLSTVLL